MSYSRIPRLVPPSPRMSPYHGRHSAPKSTTASKFIKLAGLAVARDVPTAKWECQVGVCAQTAAVIFTHDEMQSDSFTTTNMCNGGRTSRFFSSGPREQNTTCSPSTSELGRDTTPSSVLARVPNKLCKMHRFL